MQVNSQGGYDIPPRPATPLSNNTSTPPQSPMPAGPIVAAADGSVATTVFGAEVPLEDRLDIYLLGRALTEWADDDYLELLGIDRVQTEAYAAVLDFRGAHRRDPSPEPHVASGRRCTRACLTRSVAKPMHPVPGPHNRC